VRLSWLLPSALLLISCGQVSKVKEHLPDLPALDVSLFPKLGPGGTRLLADAAQARLEIDPTVSDAITALGGCVDTAVSCYHPGTAELGDCLERTRTCETKTPWTEAACCPQACKDAFAAEVKKGTKPAQAFDTVFFQAPDCFPGVRQALEAP